MNNKTKNITLLILIALTVLSFQVQAQIQLSGCTDSDALNYNSSTNIIDNGSCIYTEAVSNNAHGFNSTALIQLLSPSAGVFIFNKVIVKYRVSGTNTWTKLVFPVTVLDDDSTYAGYIDTLGVSLWYLHKKKYNLLGEVVSDGNRYLFTARINNLDPLTQYDTKIFLKGSNLISGANKTNKLNNTITTWNNPLEAPFPTAFIYQLYSFNNSNNQARLYYESNDETIVRTYNLSGQLVSPLTKGIVIHTMSDGSSKKVSQ